MARTGKIKFYSPVRRYGFVIDNDNGMEYFFTPEDFEEYVKSGDEVMYDLKQTNKGIRATHIIKLEDGGRD